MGQYSRKPNAVLRQSPIDFKETSYELSEIDFVCRFCFLKISACINVLKCQKLRSIIVRLKTFMICSQTVFNTSFSICQDNWNSVKDFLVRSSRRQKIVTHLIFYKENFVANITIDLKNTDCVLVFVNRNIL